MVPQLETALAQLFDPTEAARQARRNAAGSPLLPFDRLPRRQQVARESCGEIAQLVEEQEANDRTDLYALRDGRKGKTPYNLGIIVMTDGLSNAESTLCAALCACQAGYSHFSIPFRARQSQGPALSRAERWALFTNLLDVSVRREATFNETRTTT